MNVYIVKMGKEKRIERRIKAVSEIKRRLLVNDVVEAVSEKYGINSKEIIEGMSIVFDPELKVSGKTTDGVIYLCDDLIDDIDKAEEYAVHEYTHVCQHITNEGMPKKIKKDKSKKYLDRESEQEAFSAQVEHLKSEEGEGSAEKYVEHLLELHGVKKNSKKWKTLMKMLMGE